MIYEAAKGLSVTVFIDAIRGVFGSILEYAEKYSGKLWR